MEKIQFLTKLLFVRNKTLLVMKIFTFLFLLAMQVSAKNYGQETITINSDLAPIGKILKDIEKQTKYHFYFSNDEVNVATKVSLVVNDASISKVMDILLFNLPLEWKLLDDKMVVISTKKNYAINIDEFISGIVLDDRGLPIEGATISEKGTENKTVTNKNGEYKLKVKDAKAILIISHIGYNDQIIYSKNQKVLNITLNPTTQTLDDVVVIGYGTVKKSDLTGSVAKLKVEGNEDKPITTVDQFLQGRVAGVQLTQNSGAPGSGMSFLIRGASSVSGSNQPLFVVDGYPVETSDQNLSPRTSADFLSSSVPSTNPLAAINPNDIESIEILKDASSTAIYGSRGANGVVMITTKKGKSKKDQISYSIRGDYSKLPKKIEVLRTPDYIDYINEARINGGLNPTYTARQKDSLSSVSNYFWQDLVYQPALSLDNQLSISGGEEKTKYTLSANYRKVQGIVKNSEFSTGSVRMSLERQVLKALKLSGQFTANLNVNKAAQQSNGNGEPSGSVITGALNFTPLTDPYAANDIDPNLNASGNPLTLISKGKNVSRAQFFLLNLKAEYKIIDGLTFLLNAGGNSTTSVRNVFLPRGTYQGTVSNGLAVRSESENYNYLIENTLNYNKTLCKKHRVNAIAGYTFQQFTGKSLGFQVSNFTTEALNYNNLSLGGASTIPTSTYQVSGLSSYLGRINYTYDNRYLITLTGRADGSTRLAAGKKWAFFPAIATGWNLHNEHFFPKNDWVSELKLRASWGQSGNQSIGVGSSLDRISYIRTIVNGSNIATAFSPSSFGNENLKWEITSNINLGIDATLMNKRVTFSAEIYRRLTKDLLIVIALPGSTGYNSIATNAGSVENKGLEFTLNAKVLNKKLTWNISSNISFNRNKVLSLGNNAQIFGAGGYWSVGSVGLNQPLNIAMTGYPIGSFYGYKREGIYQNNTEIVKSPIDPIKPQPGDIKYKDVNSDGKITTDDRTVIGNPFPKYTFGITNDFSYKGFTFSFFIMGNIGQDVANMNRFPLDALITTTGYNIRKEAWDNRWRGEGTSNYYPAPRATGVIFSNRFSDFFIEDGSFVRLKNLTLAYQVPLKKSLFVKNAKVFVSATNLFTLANYKGYDPEVSSQGNSALNAGVDIGVIPQYKTYSAGVNLIF